MKRSLELDDITLVPEVISRVKSRDDIDTNSGLGGFDYPLPILVSPMIDVANSHSINEVNNLGGLGIVHRFCTIEEQVKEFKNTDTMISACAIGVTGDYFERAKALYKAGCTTFCIDVANGANQAVKDALYILSIPDNGLQHCQFIVGNVASGETYRWCSELSRKVIGVRVGIAGGTACTTKNATGVYQGMASLLMECRRIKDLAKLKTAIIADGGINTSDKLCKSIALGADFVMLGSYIAKCKDSPANFHNPCLYHSCQFHPCIHAEQREKYKVYRGSASSATQLTYKEEPKYIEGTTKLLDVGKTIKEEVGYLMNGLRSSMSYFNAKTIEEYRKNITVYRNN